MKQKQLNNILLIDDDDATNFYHKLIIKKSDFQGTIHIARHGKEAISYLISAQQGEKPVPDLILLDINMPVMDGWEFMEAYGSLPGDVKPKITLIMLSATMNPDDAARALTLPEIAEFKNKPLTEDMLQDVLKTHFS